MPDIPTEVRTEELTPAQRLLSMGVTPRHHASIVADYFAETAIDVTAMTEGEWEVNQVGQAMG